MKIAETPDFAQNRAQRQLLWIAMALGFIAIAWGMLSVSESLASHFNLAAYLIANILVFIDAIDLLVRAALMSFGETGSWGPTSVRRASPTSELQRSASYTLFQKRLHVKPWAIAVSVHNAESNLFDFLRSLDYLRERMWIIDDGSSDGTCDYLRNIGWRCLKGENNLKKPGAIEKLIDKLPSEIETIIVIDPDIEIRSTRGLGLADIEEAIFDFQRSDLAAICPRVSVRPEGLMSKFQMFEYCVAFFGRRSLGTTSITSGISLYRRSTFATMLALHSKSVYAEDLENSIRLLGLDNKVGTEPRLVIETEAKVTFRSWFSQRIGWSYGLIKVYFERFRDIRAIGGRTKMGFYHYICYMGIFSLLVQPLKAMALVLIAISFGKGVLALMGITSSDSIGLFDPAYFLIIFVKYCILMLCTWFTVVPRDERKYLAPIIPIYLFYALMLTAATTIGYINWITLHLLGRRLVKDHYDDGEELRFQQKRRAQAACA